MRRYSRGGTILVVALVLTPFFANADMPHPTYAEGEGIMSTDKSFYCLGEHVNITATGWAIVPSIGDFPDIFWAITNASGDPVFETLNLFDAVGELNGTLNGTWNQTYRLIGGQPPSGEQVPPGRYTVWFYEIPRPNETVPGWIPAEIEIGECGSGPIAVAGPDQTVYEGDIVQFNGTESKGSTTMIGGELPEIKGYSCPRIPPNDFPSEPSRPFANMVENGDFEYGMDSWSPVGSVSISNALAYNGSSSLLVNTSISNPGYAFQRIDDPGTEYLVYLWMYLVSATDGPFGVSLVRNWNQTTGEADVVALLGLSENKTIWTVWNEPVSEAIGPIHALGTWHRIVFAINVTAKALCYWIDDTEGFWGWGAPDVTSFQPEYLIVGDLSNQGQTGISHFDNLIFVGDRRHETEADIVTYEWDFSHLLDSDGDGNYTNDVDATGPTPTHIYYDDGVYVVTLKVVDASGLSDWETCNIIVLNVAPTPEWTSRSFDGTIINPPYPEGKEILFEATVYDPGIYDTFTYDWDVGDGTVYLDAGPTITHTYGDNDVYIVVLTVTDDDGGVGIDDTPPLETTNENPIASIIMPYCIFTEGTNPCEAIGEFTDPGWLDTHSAVWDYGDGTYQTAVLTEENDPPDATGMNITSHIYGDNGVYTITFTVTDDDGGGGSASAEANVINLPPTLEMNAPSPVNEGEDFVLGITATDPGSDDIILTIDWGDGTSETMIYYNNGVGPDPPNSGEGVYPFTVYANITHVYGDNGGFTVDVTVEDDDGGVGTATLMLDVMNLPAAVELAESSTGDENSDIGFQAAASDPGSDDLTFVWDWGDGTSDTAVFYNDGTGPDPPQSPWGAYPFDATHAVSHLWGDNGDFTVTLTVTDDDGGVTVEQTVVTVNNLAPTIAGISYYLNASFAFRIAGEKWHNVEIYLYEDGTEVGYANITRYPGSPNEQMADLGQFSIDFSKTYSAIAYYTPEDDPINGQIWGATPAWVILEYEDGEERIHHTFNVRHEDTWTWVIDDFSPYFLGHNITFMATASDPGSDDLTFTWDWGDGNTTEHIYYNDGVGPDPYPSPEVNPIIVTDTATHAYASAGAYTITLTVTDDDGGITSYSLNLTL